jgi:hypothetical protein
VGESYRLLNNEHAHTILAKIANNTQGKERMTACMSEFNNAELKTNRWVFALYIGFFAGFIWGAFKIVEYFFKFTSLVPGFLIEPYFKHSFLMTWKGYLVGWASFILFSIIASFVYMVALAKWKGPWIGIIYGIAWWCVIYLGIGPLTGMMNWIYYLDWNTILTDFCLFVLWGLFIGYSIALEYTNEREREPEPTAAPSKA